MAEARGDGTTLLHALGPLGAALGFVGRWDEAERVGARAVQAMHPVAPSAHSAWCLAMAGMAATVRGRRQASSALFGPGERAYAGRNLMHMTGLHHWAVGTAALAAGRTDEAAIRLTLASACLRERGMVAIEAVVTAEVVEALVAAGRLEEARRAALRMRELARRLTRPYLDAMAEFARGLVAAAARLYAALPAPGHEARVVAGLRDMGPTGRRVAQRVGALTPREREVAALAREGLPTCEIAMRLHVSERTVETHLSHVYAKLGIDGRRALSAMESTTLA